MSEVIQKSKSLTDIATEALAIESMVFEAGGEISPEIETWITQVETDLAVKADHYKFAMDRFISTAKMLKEKADEFNRASKTIEQLAERLKDRIKQVMLATAKPEILGNSYRFKLSLSQPRMIIHEHELPIAFKRQVTSLEVDKELIKNAIKAGHSIKGVQLEASHALRITVNKER